MKAQSVREQLLDHTFALIRRRGFNGFSYRDLADRVGVKTSSIHYYFPCKNDLIYEAVEHYSKQKAEVLASIPDDLPGAEKLRRFQGLVQHGVCTGKVLCLGGMVAFDVELLDERVGLALKSFFRQQEKWLANVLAEGRRDGTLVFHGMPEEAGRVLFAAVQGAALAARLFDDTGRIAEVLSRFYADTPAEQASA